MLAQDSGDTKRKSFRPHFDLSRRSCVHSSVSSTRPPPAAFRPVSVLDRHNLTGIDTIDRHNLNGRFSAVSSTAERRRISAIRRILQCSLASGPKQLLMKPPLYEVAFDLGQLRGEKLAISPDVGVAGPAQLLVRSHDRPWTGTPVDCMPIAGALHGTDNAALDGMKAGQPHRQTTTRRRIGIFAQLFKRGEDIRQAQSMRDTRDFAKPWLRLDGIRIGRPRR